MANRELKNPFLKKLAEAFRAEKISDSLHAKLTGDHAVFHNYLIHGKTDSANRVAISAAMSAARESGEFAAEFLVECGKDFLSKGQGKYAKKVLENALKIEEIKDDVRAKACHMLGALHERA